MLGAAFGLGFIIGPVLGGFLGGYGLRYPFWAAAGLSLANAAYGFFILPESLPRERRAAKFAMAKANPLGALRLLRSHAALFGLACAMFLYYLAHESLPSMFVLYTDYRYHWGTRMTGTALAVVGVCTTLVQAVLMRRATKRLGEVRTLFSGLLFGVAGFGLLAFAPNTTVLLISIPLISLWGLAGPSMQALMSRRASASEQGQLQGALASIFGIAGMIGPIMFTGIFAFAVSQQGALHVPGAPYWLASVLLLGGLLIASAVTQPAAQPLAASSGSVGD